MVAKLTVVNEVNCAVAVATRANTATKKQHRTSIFVSRLLCKCGEVNLFSPWQLQEEPFQMETKNQERTRLKEKVTPMRYFLYPIGVSMY